MTTCENPRCVRFIPAHAGNSRRQSGHQCSRAVHPRARGEQTSPSGLTYCSNGSSPRTRGTVLHRPQRRAHARFIPAHAGNRHLGMPAIRAHPVHPRARGEQCRPARAKPFLIGSSPRTRGTGHVHAAAAVVVRFIPAHAGNSIARSISSRATSVHPRARGEQRARRIFARIPRGSSPRTRGTAPAPARRPRPQRFIPAHAGNRLHLTY